MSTTSNFNDYSLVRLLPKDSELVTNHILKLSVDDIYLRFGYDAKESQIRDYVTNTISVKDDQYNFWWGIIQEDKLLATIHVAAKDDVAEFAFTTDAEYRGQKLGQLLFARGLQFVTERKINRIYMCMLSKNFAMRRIASKFGLSVTTFGTDTEASVNIQYPVPLSKIDTVKTTIIDRGILEAMSGGRRSTDRM